MESFSNLCFFFGSYLIKSICWPSYSNSVILIALTFAIFSFETTVEDLYFIKMTISTPKTITPAPTPKPIAKLFDLLP